MANAKQENTVENSEDKKPFGFKINQLGIVVEDIEKSSAFLQKIGIGPFATLDTESSKGKFKIAEIWLRLTPHQ